MFTFSWCSPKVEMVASMPQTTTCRRKAVGTSTSGIVLWIVAHSQTHTREVASRDRVAGGEGPCTERERERAFSPSALHFPFFQFNINTTTPRRASQMSTDSQFYPTSNPYAHRSHPPRNAANLVLSASSEALDLHCSSIHHKHIPSPWSSECPSSAITLRLHGCKWCLTTVHAALCSLANPVNTSEPRAGFSCVAGRA